MSRSLHAMGNMERRSEGWVVRVLAMLRVAQTLPFLFVVIKADRSAAYTYTALVLAMYFVYLAWSATLFWISLRRGTVTRKLVVTDAVITFSCVLFVGRMFRSDAATTWLNWTVGPWMAAAILVALYLPIRYSATFSCLILLAYGAGLVNASSASNAWNAFLGNGIIGVLFIVGAFLGTGHLRRLSIQVDSSNKEAIEARAAEAAMKERVRQSDILHNSALQTLTMLGRESSGLSEDLRKRCSSDAHHLRMGLASNFEGDPTSLVAQLIEVVREQQDRLHLEVSFTEDDLPSDLPRDVVHALVTAVTEALNNVAKHAGTKEVVIIATGDGLGGVELTVTDKGCGFDLTNDLRGYGLTYPLDESLRRVGGHAKVTSYKGLGTSVELRWTRQ